MKAESNMRTMQRRSVIASRMARIKHSPSNAANQRATQQALQRADGDARSRRQGDRAGAAVGVVQTARRSFHDTFVPRSFVNKQNFDTGELHDECQSCA